MCPGILVREHTVRERVARPGGRCGECVRVLWYTTSKQSENDIDIDIQLHPGLLM